MKKKVIVIGAGISGLTVAWKLVEAGFDVKVLEKSPKTGGMAASFKKDGMILDYGPHKLYSQLPGIMPKYKEILGDQCLTVKKFNSLNLNDQYFSFPLQLSQLLKKIPFLGVKCGLGYGVGLAKNIVKKKKIISYEDYLLAKFGKPMYELLFKDFAWKVWGNPQKLTAELARRRIPVSSLIDVLKNVLLPSDKVSADFFYYPKFGVGQLCDVIQSKIEVGGGEVITSVNVKKIKFEKESRTYQVFYEEKENNPVEEVADYIVSTMPIQQLPKLIEPIASKEVFLAANSLKNRSLIILYVVANKKKILKKDNWIFFPQKGYIFNRISEMKSFSPYTMDENKSVLMVEITCDFGDKIWESNADEIFNLAIKDLEKGNIISRGEVSDHFIKRAGRVYPVYSLDYKENLNTILDYLDSFGSILTIGRQGLFNYNNTDHCLDMSFTTAEHIINEGSVSDWKNARKKFDNYKIVD